MSDWVLGVIGGSGLYEMGELENTQWIKIDTPWASRLTKFYLLSLMGLSSAFCRAMGVVMRSRHQG